MWRLAGLILVCLVGAPQLRAQQDPYHWLAAAGEEPVQQWLSARERESEAWWSQQPSEALSGWEQRLRELWSMPRLDLPQPMPGYDYFFFSAGLASNASFYRLPVGDATTAYCEHETYCELPAGAERLLAADWFDQGRILAVQISPDQRYLAYAVGQLESGRADWFLAPVGAAAGPQVDALIAADLRALHWSTDAVDTLYFQSEGAERMHRLHVREGMPVNEHALPPLPLAGRPTLVAASSAGLLVRVTVADRDELWLQEHEGGWQQLLAEGAEWLHFVTEAQGGLWFRDYRDSEYGAVTRLTVTQTVTQTGQVDWQTVLAAGAQRLQQVVVSMSGLLASYQQAATSSLHFLPWQSERGWPIVVPLSSQAALNLSATPHSERLYVQASTLDHAPALWQLQSVAGRPALAPRWQAETRQSDTSRVILQSIPLGAESSALLLLAGPAPVLERWQQGRVDAQPLLLETYSGFDLPLQLDYSPSRRAWFEAGGLYARVAVRGSGDHDALWHWQGSGPRRQNSIDDLLQVADWLVAQGLTRTDLLAAMGVSHGATLMAAAVAQQPQSFAALIAVAGVMDMLRYPESGAGAAWLAEYGDPQRAPDAAALQNWSPYHRLLREDAAVRHPSALLISNQGDPVVSAWHSMKHHAVLIEAGRARSPQLLSLLPEASHPESLDVQALIRDYARRWLFLQQVLGRE